MGLFNKKTQEEATPRKVNPTNMILIRFLAVGYVLWLLKDLVGMYIEGGEDAPSLTLLLVTAVVFIAGCTWIVIVSIKQYKQIKAQQEAEAAALAEEQAALEAAQEAEAWEEVPKEETEE